MPSKKFVKVPSLLLNCVDSTGLVIAWEVVPSETSGAIVSMLSKLIEVRMKHNAPMFETVTVDYGEKFGPAIEEAFKRTVQTNASYKNCKVDVLQDKFHVKQRIEQGLSKNHPCKIYTYTCALS